MKNEHYVANKDTKDEFSNINIPVTVIGRNFDTVLISTSSPKRSPKTINLYKRVKG